MLAVIIMILLAGGIATNLSLFGTNVNERNQYILDRVDCSGNELNIFDCPHPLRTNCKREEEEAGVICGVNPGN